MNWNYDDINEFERNYDHEEERRSYMRMNDDSAYDYMFGINICREIGKRYTRATDFERFTGCYDEGLICDLLCA